MPWASFSMLDGPGGAASSTRSVKHWKWCPWHQKASVKTQVSLTRFLQSEVKIIHIIVQNNTYYKITIFGACAPYSRLIYWTASSISQEKKDGMSLKCGSWSLVLGDSEAQVHSRQELEYLRQLWSHYYYYMLSIYMEKWKDNCQESCG